LWHAGWRADPASARVVIGFSLPTREAVDERYAELTSAGYAGRQPPFDAFWGARYAIVADPDGNDVGLISPLEEWRRTWPAKDSPPPDRSSGHQLAAAFCVARAGEPHGSVKHRPAGERRTVSIAPWSSCFTCLANRARPCGCLCGGSAGL
jgi:glyoxalase/bleomycin resistance protein/dioxygenase superfamily protein